MYSWGEKIRKIMFRTGMIFTMLGVAIAILAGGLFLLVKSIAWVIATLHLGPLETGILVGSVCLFFYSLILAVSLER